MVSRTAAVDEIVQPLSTREAVSKAIERLELSSVASKIPPPILVKIVLTMMKLMEDDDSDVREDVARVAAAELLLLSVSLVVRWPSLQLQAH